MPASFLVGCQCAMLSGEARTAQHMISVYCQGGAQCGVTALCAAESCRARTSDIYLLYELCSYTRTTVCVKEAPDQSWHNIVPALGRHKRRLWYITRYSMLYATISTSGSCGVHTGLLLLPTAQGLGSVALHMCLLLLGTPVVAHAVELCSNRWRLLLATWGSSDHLTRSLPWCQLVRFVMCIQVLGVSWPR